MTQVCLAKTQGVLGSYTCTDRKSRSNLGKSDSASFASLRERKSAQTTTKPHTSGGTLSSTHANSLCGLLFLLICIGYLCTFSDKYFGQISDGQIMFETAVSLREFGELGIRPDRDPVSGQIAEYDRIRKYGVGFSIVQQAPLLFVPLVEKILGDGRSNALLPFTNLLLTAMTALLVALCMREMGFRFRTGALAAAGFAFSTFAWPYISYDFSVMVYFSAWLNIVGLHSERIPLDIEGRPNSEYEEHDDRRWFYPAIATYYLPSLSPILGHAWLLRLRYFDVPFSLRMLSDPSSGPLPSVKYPPLQFNFEPLKDLRGRFVIWQLRSANLWLWDTLLQRPREVTLSYPIYGLMLERLGDRADKQGNARRALSCYRRAVELMPVYINASLKLSQIYFKLGARRS